MLSCDHVLVKAMRNGYLLSRILCMSITAYFKCSNSKGRVIYLWHHATILEANWWCNIGKRTPCRRITQDGLLSSLLLTSSQVRPTQTTSSAWGLLLTQITLFCMTFMIRVLSDCDFHNDVILIITNRVLCLQVV